MKISRIQFEGETCMKITLLRYQHFIGKLICLPAASNVAAEIGS